MHTILIVDDNASLAYFTAGNLNRELKGLRVLTAGSCEEALALADEHSPSVSIVDLVLPDGDGLDLIQDLKGRFRDMVSILITARTLPDDSHPELFGLLVKPYDIDTLIDLVREALRSGNSPGRPAGGTRAQKETVAGVVQYDFHQVQNRLSGLLAGIRAFGADLRAVADDPGDVRETVDEYVDRLCAIVKDVAETLKQGTDRR